MEFEKGKINSETVEKVPKQILGRDAERNDLIECATINDLTTMRSHETPPKAPINYAERLFDNLSKKVYHEAT